jgi:hypothetical protein
MGIAAAVGREQQGQCRRRALHRQETGCPRVFAPDRGLLQRGAGIGKPLCERLTHECDLFAA